MAWADRQMGPDSGGGFFAPVTPVVKWLLLLNIGIYILDILLKQNAPDGPLRIAGAFTVESAFLEGRIWELVAFQFLHGNVGHLLMNCIGLLIFGPFMERWWGPAKFIGFYLLCGIGGALFYTLLISIGILPDQVVAGVNGAGRLVMAPANQVPLVGASAGIYGILVGVAVTAPAMVVTLLFPPVSLTMRRLAFAVLIISVVIILFGIGDNEGGEAGHLGGAIAGFLLIRGWMAWSSSGRGPVAKRRQPRKDIEAKIKPRTTVDLDEQSEVDAILDKISKDGFQSITEEEHNLLRRAAEKGDKRK